MNLFIATILVGIVGSALGTNLSDLIEKSIIAKGQTMAILIRKKILAVASPVKLVFIAGQTNLSQQGAVAAIDLANIYGFKEIEFIYKNPVPVEGEAGKYAAACKAAMDILVVVMQALGVKVHLVTAQMNSEEILKPKAAGTIVYALDFIVENKFMWDTSAYDCLVWNLKLLEDAIIAGCKIVVVDVFSLQDVLGNAKLTGHTPSLSDSQVLADVYISIEGLTQQIQEATTKATSTFYLIHFKDSSLVLAMKAAIGSPLKDSYCKEIGGYTMLSFANTREIRVSRRYNDNITSAVVIDIVPFIREYANI